MIKNILVIFAHPKLELSVVNKHLLLQYKQINNLVISDLYELYPDGNIDIEAEQKKLIYADLIIWQHPLYWYSCPPLLKQWIDLVLEFGWAYGPKGIVLKDKFIFNSISSGGQAVSYTLEGRHGHTLKQFLLPFAKTASLCGMKYLPPFAIQGTHNIKSEELKSESAKLMEFLRICSNIELDFSVINSLDLLNHFDFTNYSLKS